MTVFYRDGRNGNLHSMTRSDYRTLKEFEIEVRRNGFRVVASMSDKQVQHIKDSRPSQLPVSIPDSLIDYIKQCI